MKQKGFTLVEMMVVMGIIAILSLISVGALISSRDSSLSSAAADDFFTNIRDSQNKSFSVQKDKNNNETKVWGISIASGGVNYRLVSLYNGAGVVDALDKTIEKTYPINGSKVTLRKYEAATGSTVDLSGDIFIAFASPFARSYILENTDCSRGETCNWKESSRPTRDWEIASLTDYVSSTKNARDYYLVDFTNNQSKTTVKILANGDASVE